VTITAVAGGLVALQAPINAGLARHTGNLEAGFVSYAVGTVVLTAIIVLSGKTAGLGASFDAGWVYLTGGLLGAIYVTAALLTVRWIGATGLVAATITGQLGASLVLDRLGILGLDQAPISALRILGVVLLVAGTYFVVR
jgi:transporter family-2 protein